MYSTLAVSHLLTSPLKTMACSNIFFMLVTEAVSHLLRSPLKTLAFLNT